ncbi:MAG: hypothetical protein V7676_09875 [Parasphingorhabdus sp.]|uniref:hypothetical protein n=1 Tax=Parasphingorhabdus sp. TaxID=2709688 RepID=UPI0030020EE0
MNLSNQGFSPLDDSISVFIPSPFRFEDTGFLPKYTANLELRTNAIEPDDRDENIASPDDALNQRISDAYTQGYLNGQQAAMVHADEHLQREDGLAEALNRLKTSDDKMLTKKLLEAVLSLFQEAVGNAKIDRIFLEQRCQAALDMLKGDTVGACLHVAESDAKILQGYDCDIPIIATSELLPGAVQLVYPSGQIISGSLPMVQALESRIISAGNPSC